MASPRESRAYPKSSHSVVGGRLLSGAVDASCGGGGGGVHPSSSVTVTSGVALVRWCTNTVLSESSSDAHTSAIVHRATAIGKMYVPTDTGESARHSPSS